MSTSRLLRTILVLVVALALTLTGVGLAQAAPPAPPAALGPCDGTIDPGEVISCATADGTDVFDLTFAATAGDRFLVRAIVTSGALNPLATVRRGGTTVCAATFADQFACQITVTGTHTLRIDTSGTTAGAFSTTIERLNAPSSCPAVAFGPNGVASTIGAVAEIDCRAATGAVGQRWRVRLVETSGAATLVHEVVRPDGSTVCPPTANVESTCLLDAAGTHRVVITDLSGVQTGGYRLVVEQFPAPTGCAALTLGAPVTASVTSAGRIVCRQVAGLATGDVVRLRAIAVSGALNPLTEVLRPDGTTACALTFADELTCTADVAGAYTVLVRDGNGVGAATGDVRLAAERLNDPSSCPAVALGPTGVASTVGAAGEIDCRDATGASGQRWRVRLVETSGAATLVHEVVRPNGTTVCPPTAAVESTCLLDSAGKHRVVVTDLSGLQTGGYRLVVQKFPAPKGCAALALGVPETVSVADAGGLVCRRLTGLAVGDRVRLRAIAVSGALNPLTEVLRPDGTTACALTFADELTCTADVAGVYTVLVRDGNGVGAGTGEVRLAAERLNAPSSCPAVPFGPTGVASTVGVAGEIDCWAATGAVGQRWRVRVVETSGSATLVHEVVRPDGSTVCGGNGAVESTCLLDAAGPHRVVVTDLSGLQTGGYRLVVQRFPSPTGCPVLTLGAPANAETIDDPGELSCHRFTASTGAQVRVRVADQAGGTITPLVEVVRPDGTTVCGPTFAADFTCTPTSSGQHVVVVRDGAGVGAGTGGYTVRADLL